MDDEVLIKTVIEAAMKVRQQLVSGYEEKVYKNALFIELRKHGLTCLTEVPYAVYYDCIPVGEYRADIVVENQLVLELKATESLQKRDHIQLVNYLTASGIDNGLLINFGADPIEIKRKYRVYRPSHPATD